MDSRLIMNGYTFDIHINCCLVLDAQADVRFKYDLLEVGPLNMIRFDVVNKVRAAVRSISSSPVPLNWWIGDGWVGVESNFSVKLWPS